MSELQFINSLITGVRGRWAALKSDSDRGASTVEWAILVAMAVGAAVTVAGLVVAAVNRHAAGIQ